MMLSLRKVQGAMLSAAVASALCTTAVADIPLPQPVHKGEVTYISGGIGLDEQHALEASAKNYNLHITNANKAGDFTLGTDLVIEAKNGRNLLRVANTGPLFYAKLPPGDYVIHAMNDRQNRTRDVKVAAGHTADVHLIWPQRG